MNYENCIDCLYDRKKELMVKMTTAYRDILAKHQLYATGTTGLRIAEATGLDVHRYKSGPLGATNNRRYDFRRRFDMGDLCGLFSGPAP